MDTVYKDLGFFGPYKKQSPAEMWWVKTNVIAKLDLKKPIWTSGETGRCGAFVWNEGKQEYDHNAGDDSLSCGDKHVVLCMGGEE